MTTLVEHAPGNVMTDADEIGRFYGIEATLRDSSGNWFSMTQRG